MSKPYDAEHERIETIILRNETRINNHAVRIDKLEQFQRGTEVQIGNLVEQIKSLVNTIKWMMTSTIILLAGFLIWYIQKL